MAIVGIIAEYNPFHRGHAWQIRELRRRLGEDTAVIVAMSGNFVQRGEPALADKHARAEMALRGGADLVMELPTAWSTASAEVFARGGVSLLAATGVVTHLAFGCECGDLAPLLQTARSLNNPDFPDALQRRLSAGVTFAAARQAAAEELSGGSARCLQSPNNTLAVEYLRALSYLDSHILPLALPRVGAGHDSRESSPLPSASLIREHIAEHRPWETLLPDFSSAILRREISSGRAPVFLSNSRQAVLARLRMMDEEEFALYDGGNEGLYHRFYSAVHSQASPEDILRAVKTRRYPLSRLRRMLLHSYLSLRPAGPEDHLPYLRILGANAAGRCLLREMGTAASLPLLTKPADVRLLGEPARSYFALESRCTDLYTLAFPDPAQSVPGREYTQNPIILP